MAGKGHIKVSVADLNELATTLARLKNEFDDASNIVGGYSGSLGSGDVANAMHSFATNWSIHRKDLCDAIGGLGTTAEDAAKLYDGVDSHLAAALEKASQNNSGE
jgi:hypothetical protein